MEKDAVAAPALEHVGVGLRKTEEAEGSKAGKWEGKPVDQIHFRLAAEPLDEPPGVGAQRRFQGPEAPRSHYREHGLAHRAVPGRVRVVEGRDPLEARAQHFLGGRADGHQRRGGVSRRPTLPIEQNGFDLHVASNHVVVQLGDVEDRRFVTPLVQHRIRIQDHARIQQIEVFGYRTLHTVPPLQFRLTLLYSFG